MGTRNLTAVFLDGEYRVAQYGQWDGYLEGQGSVIVEFLARVVAEDGLEKFKEQVRKCHFMTGEESDAVYEGYTTGDGWMTMDQADAFKKSEFGYLSRDTGGQILQLIYESQRARFGLQNQLAFVADSLFCEYAYVVDLDAGVLEIFEGFNKTPLEPQDRFYSFEDQSEGEYHPVKQLAKLPIDSNIEQALFDLIAARNAEAEVEAAE